MSKSIKFKSNIYLDSSTIVNNNNNNRKTLKELLFPGDRPYYILSTQSGTNTKISFPTDSNHTLVAFLVEKNNNSAGMGICYQNGVSNILNNMASIQDGIITINFGANWCRFIIISSYPLNYTLS